MQIKQKILVLCVLTLLPATQIFAQAPIPLPVPGAETAPAIDPIYVAQRVLWILFVLFAIGFVIFLIIAGFRFLTAGGDASKADKARDSIIFAIVGLIIVVAAWGFLHWILDRLGVASPF